MTQSYPPHDPHAWQQQPPGQQLGPQWLPPNATPPPPPKKKRVWPYIVAGLFGLMVIGVVNADPAPTPATPSRNQTTPPVPFQAAEPVEAAPSGPLTSFSDGTYEVGTGDGQVAPGKYKSPGASTCYWARLKSNDGSLGDILDNNVGEGQMLLNVKDSDGYVEIRGCEFTKT
jgi:hypothetical protein